MLTLLSTLQTEEDITDHGLYNAAVILSSLDDDVNALAAWSNYTPILPTADADAGSTSDAEGEGRLESIGKPSNAGDGAKEDTVAGATQESPESESLESANESSDTVTANGLPVIEAAASNAKSALSGSLHNSCDGDCGAIWTYADDM